MNTRAPTSTPPFIGYPAKTYPTTPLTRYQPKTSLLRLASWTAAKKWRKTQDFLLTKEHLIAWEEQHGQIPAGSWVFMRSDWRKVASPDNYANIKEDGAHHPGPDHDCVQWMIKERDVLGFGTECIGTDAGIAMSFDPPLPCHYFMHGAGKYGLQCMTNLDLLPPTGAVILCPPLKIEGGSGSPLRVLALVSD